MDHNLVPLTANDIEDTLRRVTQYLGAFDNQQQMDDESSRNAALLRMRLIDQCIQAKLGPTFFKILYIFEFVPPPEMNVVFRCTSDEGTDTIYNATIFKVGFTTNDDFHVLNELLGKHKNSVKPAVYSQGLAASSIKFNDTRVCAFNHAVSQIVDQRDGSKAASILVRGAVPDISDRGGFSEKSLRDVVGLPLDKEWFQCCGGSPDSGVGEGEWVIALQRDRAHAGNIVLPFSGAVDQNKQARTPYADYFRQWSSPNTIKRVQYEIRAPWKQLLQPNGDPKDFSLFSREIV
jgi:hypothetical protein